VTRRAAAFLATLALSAPVPALAQSAHICDGWQSQAWNLAEPWEANTRSFANGAIRVALIDTVEPAAAAYFLLVLHPLPGDEMEARVCHLVGEGPLTGFAGMDFAALAPAYDPATGLTLTLPVTRMDANGGFFTDRLSVTINQTRETISAVFR
jgi:hypothetical protein